MRIQTRIVLSVAAMLIISIVSSVGALLTARLAAFHVERSELAHAQYRAYLDLSAHTFQLYKQFGDALLGREAEVAVSERGLEEQIRADVAALRRIVAQEVAMVGGEELDEFDFLEQLELQVEYLLKEYARGIETLRDSPPSDRWRNYGEIMDHGLGFAFEELIGLGLREEAEEVAATRGETLSLIWRYQVLAMLLALAAVVAGAASVVSLVRGVQRPVAEIVEGASAFAAGDYSRRLDERGAPECAELSVALNRLVDEVERREEALSEANRELEARIARRTSTLQEALDTLRRSERHRRMMLADVSHELRTPLTIILGEADVTLRGGEKSPEEYRESLARVRDTADHTSRIVEDLLFIARHEAGELRLRVEALDLGDLIVQSVRTNQQRAEEAGKVIAFVPPIRPVEVLADAVRIRQVIDILLDNAIRYGEHQIGVSLSTGKGRVRVAVSDDGPGLSEEEQTSIFERFYRGAGGRESHADGAGIGLPVAKTIIEAHDARIEIDSRRGEGATFTFELPLSASIDTAA